MTNNRFPTVGSGRLKEGGRLATDKQDFNAHWQGNGFRHLANQVDVNTISNLSGTNVQTVLEELEVAVTSKGTGYISIGQSDGYALGVYNVGTVETPTLADAFAAAFSDRRLQNGGVVLVLAGTYHLKNTVTVPPGITIMGESSGTLIIGQMTEQPMFVVDYTTETHSIGGDSGSGPVTATTGSNLDGSGFAYLMLADNLDGYVASGGPSMVTVPMIQCKISSDLTLEHVSFLGRLNSGTVAGRSKTLSAISYTTGGGTGTNLKVNNCFFDGLKLAINFLPNHGADDFLTVKNCKARTYGTEDAGSTSASLNCFINTSLCNASIIDNYYVGAGSQVNTMVAIASAGGSSAVNMVISGNYGGPNGASGDLVRNLSGTSFKMNFTGNHWGQNLDNPWHLVVGGSNNGSPGGDLFGSGAINIVLSLALNNAFSGTVIVNPGTYTVTGNATAANNYANLKFIGNKNGKNYPVFNLNLSASTTDSLGNRALALGSHLESIQFNSVTNRHSIRPGFSPTSVSAQSAGTSMEVVDCIFTNTSLYALGLGNVAFTDSLGNITNVSISIRDCFFLQDGTFADTISLVLPVAHVTEIDRCVILGNGYALSVGTTGYTGAQGYGTLSITNSIFDVTDYTITGTSLINSYVSIDSRAISVDMRHCRIYADNTYTNGGTPVSTSLLNSGLFSKFVYLNAESLDLDHCDIVGPIQTYINSGTTYALPTLRVEPVRTAKIVNSKLFGGYLPLQVGGDGTFNDTATIDGIVIDSCQFNSIGQTLIDFDLAINDTTGYTPFNSPYITLSKCNLAGGTDVYPAFHALAAGSFYDTVGVVQIYAGQCNVFIDQNNITGNLSAVNGFNNVVGIVVDNYHDPSAVDGAVAATTIVTNNSIQITNTYTSATSTKAAACLLLRSSVIEVMNNHIAMNNTASISGSFIGCLILDNIATVTGYSACQVSNNTLSRRAVSGGATVLARGYVQITSTSGLKGFIVDNYFDSTTYNGSSFTLVEDNSTSGSEWTVQRNKNQTSSLVALFPSGTKSVTSNLVLSNMLLAGTTGTNSYISGHLVNTDQVTYTYASGDIGTTIEYHWAIDLSGLLPLDVRITNVSLTYQASSVPVTAKTIAATVTSINGANVNTTTIANTSANTITVTLTNLCDTRPGSKPLFDLRTTINSSSSLTLIITGLTFTYRW